MTRERRHVLYTGRVQGVGFRATAVRVSRGYDVTGFVRNLADGRVEIVAEGEGREVDAFLIAVKDALRLAIRSEVVESEPPGETPFHAFLVQY